MINVLKTNFLMKIGHHLRNEMSKVHHLGSKAPMKIKHFKNSIYKFIFDNSILIKFAKQSITTTVIFSRKIQS